MYGCMSTGNVQRNHQGPSTLTKCRLPANVNECVVGNTKPSYKTSTACVGCRCDCSFSQCRCRCRKACLSTASLCAAWVLADGAFHTVVFFPQCCCRCCRCCCNCLATTSSATGPDAVSGTNPTESASASAAVGVVRGAWRAGVGADGGGGDGGGGGGGGGQGNGEMLLVVETPAALNCLAFCRRHEGPHPHVYSKAAAACTAGQPQHAKQGSLSMHM